MTTLPHPLAEADLAPFSVRPMLLTDIDNVLAVETLSFPSVWSEKGYRNELTRNKMARYSVLELTQTEGTPHLIGFVGNWLMAGELHISTIALHPEWRGRGLGELLLLWTLWEGVTLTADLATLEVRENNTVAQKLYRKYAFRQVGVRKRYYKDTGEDGYIMTVSPFDRDYRDYLTHRQTQLLDRLGRST